MQDLILYTLNHLSQLFSKFSILNPASLMDSESFLSKNYKIHTVFLNNCLLLLLATELYYHLTRFS